MVVSFSVPAAAKDLLRKVRAAWRCRTVVPGDEDAVLRAVVISYFVLSTSFYALAYFFEQPPMTAHLPVGLRYLKEAAWGLLLIVAAPTVRRAFRSGRFRVRAGTWIAVQFVAAFAALAAVHGVARFSDRWAITFLKNFLLYSPTLLIVLALKDPVGAARKVLPWWVGAAVVQVVAGFLLRRFFPEALFWRNDPWNGFDPLVGALANPNRFALFVNAALGGVLAWALTRDRWPDAVAGTAVACLLALGVVFSGATSQCIVSLGLLAYAFLFSRWALGVSYARVAPTLGAVAGTILVVGLPIYRKTAAIDGLCNLIWGGGGLGPVSNSVSNRREEFLWIWNHAREADPLSFLFGHTAAKKFITFDPQYGDVFVNAGGVGLASLLILIFGAGVWAVHRAWEAGPVRDRPVMAFFHWAAAVFGATFLIDSGLYDFPTGFLFFLVFGFLSAMAGDRAVFRPRS